MVCQVPQGKRPAHKPYRVPAAPNTAPQIPRERYQGFDHSDPVIDQLPINMTQNLSVGACKEPVRQLHDAALKFAKNSKANHFERLFEIEFFFVF